MKTERKKDIIVDWNMFFENFWLNDEYIKNNLLAGRT